MILTENEKKILGYTYPSKSDVNDNALGLKLLFHPIA